MYKIFILIATLAFLSCSKEDDKNSDPSKVDLATLNGIGTKSPLVATIKTVTGQEINQIDALKASTEYQLTLKGEDVDYVRIKYGHIFDILESPSGNEPKGEFTFRIKTSADFADQIYINVVPLHKKGPEYLREQSQVYFLP